MLYAQFEVLLLIKFSMLPIKKKKKHCGLLKFYVYHISFLKNGNFGSHCNNSNLNMLLSSISKNLESIKTTE